MTEDRNSLKEKLDQENKNLNTVKQFARKLRDEKVLLETENTKIKVNYEINGCKFINFFRVNSNPSKTNCLV